MLRSRPVRPSVSGDESLLESGDVLYLPRGFIHSAEALGGVSVHLTIGIHSHTRHDLVQALLELAADDPRLRRSLPLGIDVGAADQLETEAESTIDALVEQFGRSRPPTSHRSWSDAIAEAVDPLR